MTLYPVRLRGLTAIAVVAATVVFVALAAREGLGEWRPLLLFGALFVFSEHRAVTLAGGVAVSAGFMVEMGALVVHDERGSLASLMLVGACGALYLPNLRKGYRGWLPFNAALLSLAMLAAGLAFRTMPVTWRGEIPLALIALLPAVAAYLAVSWAFLAVSYLVEGDDRWRDLSSLGRFAAEMLPFAVLGFLLGRLYLDLGAGVMLLIIVPILIAREMFASYLKVKESHDETVNMLVRALETKDPYTAGHAGRVATYAQYIGEGLNFGPGRMERLRFAALMHDIGKLVVPNHLLNKPGKLTEEEFRRIRIHEKVSVQMLSHIDFLRPIASASHSDHTRFDPDDPDHPIEPYIVMIADAYDAMTSTRSYRKALSQEVAFQELRDKAGTQFHPQCVEALIHAIEARGERHGAGFEAELHFEDAPEAGLGSAGLGDLLSKDA